MNYHVDKNYQIVEFFSIVACNLINLFILNCLYFPDCNYRVFLTLEELQNQLRCHVDKKKKTVPADNVRIVSTLQL